MKRLMFIIGLLSISMTSVYASYLGNLVATHCALNLPLPLSSLQKAEWMMGGVQGVGVKNYHGVITFGKRKPFSCK